MAHKFETRSQDQFLNLPHGVVMRYKHWNPKGVLKNVHVLMLQGRATAIEKSEHFIHKLVDQGYEVWSFDWREQGRSTRSTGRRGYIDSYNSYLSDMGHFVNQILLPASGLQPRMLLGHSMGGHIGLRYMAENPKIFQGALMVSPMFDIRTGIYPRKIAAMLTHGMCLLGLDKTYVFGHGDYDPVSEPFEGNLLTRNAAAFYEHRRIHLENPDLTTGGATFGWVAATMDSVETLMRRPYLSQIDVPVHILVAEEEKIVDNSRVQRACTWMNHCSLEVIKGAKHQLFSEYEEVQDHILQVFNQMTQALYARVHRLENGLKIAEGPFFKGEPKLSG